jgi:hypothetical protein
LQYAVDHKISFHNVLGSIQSTGVANAPYIKVRLLEEIANGAKNHRDLSKGAGVSEVLKSQLTTLDSLGLISYTSIPEESANKRIFSWVAEMPFEKVRPVRAYPHLTSQIVDWFKQNRVGNKNTICRDINYDYSANVSRVLTDLTQQGCITSRYPGNTRSNIELLPAGKELWGFFKSVREALSSDDNPQIKAFRDVLNEFKRDNALFERYLIEGIERYIPISQWSTSQPREETEKQILDFVSLYQEKYGFGPRPMEISKSLAIPAVRESFYLIDLANRGSLKRIRKGRESRYSLPMQ